MKKILYIVLDGLGDLSIKEFGGKTPLEVASTPNMDFLAKEGIQGFIHPVEKDIAPESDIAVISLLGYEAKKVYTGRGPLESYAEGIEVKDGDLALRVNFATMDAQTFRLVDRRVGRNLTTEEATQLSQEINDKVKLQDADFIFKNTVGHRGVLVIRKEQKLKGTITNTDPAYGKEGVFGIALEEFEPFLKKAEPLVGYENDEGAILSANLLNEFTEKSQKVLENSPINVNRKAQGKLVANVILSRDAGHSLPKFKTIKECLRLNFASFVQMPVERGIALLCGMEVIDLPQSQGDLKRDYTLWAEKAKDNLAKFDGLYIHIKGPDEPAHDGNCNRKKEIIELIDKYFFGNLLPYLENNVIIAVTGDHSTPCNLKAHSADPVPVLVYGSALKDNTSFFGESEAQKGTLGKMLGRELIYRLVELAKEE